ncbi:MAG: copper amine oxidase N-terminal domain-containing protein [Bacillota bacterium]
MYKKVRRMLIVMLVLILVFSFAGAVMAKGGPPEKVLEKIQVKQEAKTEIKEAREPREAKEAREEAKFQKLEQKIMIKGKELKFDVPPVIKEGRTLIPIRAIANGLGADVEWDSETKTITMSRDGITIILVLDSMEVTVINAEGDEDNFVLEVPAQLISNRTFVPLRFISQALGNRVDYSLENGIIIGEGEGEEGEVDEGLEGDEGAPEDDLDTEEDDEEVDDDEDEESTDDGEDDEEEDEEEITEE